MILTGGSLGERQRELNAKVNEAVSKKYIFEEIIEQEGSDSDVDKLFKIDLASKYENVSYIIEVLKSGDSLYISRALKCIWLYNDQNTTIINPHYLHHNIFPEMSLKMRKKMLSAISMHVRNEDRAADFYSYCKNIKMIHLANKFLMFTSENFKLNVIQNQIELLNDMEDKNLLFFIGTKFKLANAYLECIEDRKKTALIYNFRHLYSVCSLKYFEMLETHEQLTSKYEYDSRNTIRFGQKVSDDIMKNHKDRVLKNPILYINILKEKVIVRNSTAEDAKIYINALLPSLVDVFWQRNFCTTHEYILNLLPSQEIYEYVKEMFTNKYPTEPFEMTKEFYNCMYYRFLSVEKREEWAFRHLESKMELHGVGRDYIWYKFINFEKAISAIKKYIRIATDSDKREEIVSILIESCRNQCDLEHLLNYYYERHANEIIAKKQNFIDKVLNYHKVFDFDQNCWTAFNKLFYSLEVYNPLNDNRYIAEYRIISWIYHIINKQDCPAGLLQYFDSTSINDFNYEIKPHLEALKEEQKELVYRHMFQFHVDKISHFDDLPYNDDVRYKVRNIIRFVKDLQRYFKKSDNELPDIFLKYKKMDSEYFFPKGTEELLTPGKITRLLKQDATRLKDFDLLTYTIGKTRENSLLSQVLKKLKVYFANDIAKDYLIYFKSLLSNASPSYNIVYTAVYGIFQLADENGKSDFILEYTPLNSKIDRISTDTKTIYIQESICRFACYSRPNVSLAQIITYIRGDYVRYCLPMFNLYLANLPLPLCFNFVESLLDKPVSVQKHGIRLAYQCFDTETLSKYITTAWKKTQNVSLRVVLFTSLYNHLLLQDQQDQEKLYQTLKLFTASVHQDDHEDIIHKLTDQIKLPLMFRGDFMETASLILNKFTENSTNLDYKTRLLKTIEHHIELMPIDALQKIMNDHIIEMLNERKIQPDSEMDKYVALHDAKWSLIAMYFVKYSEDEKNLDLVLKLIRIIISKSLEMWNDRHYKWECEVFTLREFCFDFINSIIKKHFVPCKPHYAGINPVFENILSDLRSALPVQQIYMLDWKLRLAIIVNNIIDHEGIVQPKDDSNVMTILKKAAGSYAIELENVVKEFVEKQLYFVSFTTDVIGIINKDLENILDIVQSHYNQYYITLIDMSIWMSSELVNFKTLQSALIAVKMLPAGGTRYSSEEFDDLLDKIKKYDNIEFQCILYQKLVDNGFRSFFKLL